MTTSNPVGGTFDKVDAINDAYSQLRISGITVIPTPDDLDLALERLECMAAEWASRNIGSGYNFEDTPDPNSPSGVKRSYKQAYATNLAVRLIPDFGKDVPPTLFSQAVQSLSNLSGRSAMERINGVPYPSRQPRGSGNTLRYNRWARFYRNETYSPNSYSTVSMYIGDIIDLTEHFGAYLEDETLATATFQLDDGLSLVSSTVATPDVTYRVEALSGTGSGSTQQLTIIATTSTGRVTTRIVNFQISARPSDA